MLTIYARREPAQDDVLSKYAPGAKRWDTVFYGNKRRLSASFMGALPWHYSGHPRKTGSRHTINCVTYRVVMLPRLTRRGRPYRERVVR